MDGRTLKASPEIILLFLLASISPRKLDHLHVLQNLTVIHYIAGLDFFEKDEQEVGSTSKSLVKQKAPGDGPHTPRSTRARHASESTSPPGVPQSVIFLDSFKNKKIIIFHSFYS